MMDLRMFINLFQEIEVENFATIMRVVFKYLHYNERREQDK